MAMKHDHPHGLIHDLRAIALSRRRMLRMMGGAALVPILGCTTSNAGTIDAGTGDAGSAGTGSCATIPQETGGPYPGDGTNGPNALATSGIVRSDIRSSFSGATGVADGVVLGVTMTIVHVSAGCTPLSGYAVYIWHCDRAGNYSMYSAATVNENYLRGVQATDASGVVKFTTIYPGCYAGRWPHIHFEVYSSLASATRGSNAVRTSQIAMPTAASAAVYATAAYATSAGNFSGVSLSSDGVFRDGATLQTPAISGSASTGYAIALAVGV
jgi:protocatechuate 3,4-dioxygenase beta subunit